MSNSVVSLAIFDGFWGQVFEYWPLSLLVVLTIGYVIVALGSELIFGKRGKAPPGAEPRVEIEIDPSVYARNRFRTGLYLIRIAVVVSVVVAVIFAFVAHNPLSIGAQYGLTQTANDATAMGTRIGLIAAAIAVLSMLFIRQLPLMLIGLIVLAVLTITFAPAVFNGEMRWVGIMATVMAIPLVLVGIGSVMAFKNYAEAFRPKDAEPARVR